jgi:dTDP-4-amino-4,6-dideoxygalactose transaminase
MKSLKMVDLAGQYQRIKAEVDEAIAGVIASTAFINGADVKAFAGELENFLSAGHVIPCANGTDALQVIMMAMDFKPGDEVITASFTYVATAEVIALLGLTPVLVDALPGTFTLDPRAVEKAITPKTVAVVPVHLFGQCADMEAILEIASRHGIKVIEDAAQAIGSEYTFSDGRRAMAGTMGDAGSTSFFPSKNLGCYGDGGAIFTNDAALAGRIRMTVNHGQSEQYRHDRVGVNSRLDSLQAAVLRVKLRHLKEFTAARQRAAAYYDKAFAGCPYFKIPGRQPASTHVFHQYTLTLNDGHRDELRAWLSARGIPTMVYYPIPLHLQKAYRSDRYGRGAFPVTESLAARVLSLPMHTELSDDDLKHITGQVLAFYAETPELKDNLR